MLLRKVVYNAINNAETIAIIFPIRYPVDKGKLIRITPEKPTILPIMSLVVFLNFENLDNAITKKGDVETKTVASIIVVLYTLIINVIICKANKRP